MHGRNDDIPGGSLAERAGMPELGWLPELVVMLVLLSATGMVTGFLTVGQAVLGIAFAAGLTWAQLARRPRLRVLPATAPAPEPRRDDGAPGEELRRAA